MRDESFIKKVEKFNEAYRLTEKGAVLNWFDITAPDGFFSLNDTVGDIMSNEDGNKSCRNCFRALDRQRHKAWNEQWHDEDAEWIHSTPNDQYDGTYQSDDKPARRSRENKRSE